VLEAGSKIQTGSHSGDATGATAGATAGGGWVPPRNLGAFQTDPFTW
jgi:hypothetical protein